MMKKITFIMASVLAVFTVQAQNKNWCATDHYFEQKAQENPALYQQRELTNQSIREWIQLNGDKVHKINKSGQPTYIIPTVVHVINDVTGGDIITQEEIEAGIQNLNIDLRRQNVDSSQTSNVFKPFAADFGIEFRLATIDPNGNCTKGVSKVRSAQTNSATDGVKSLAYWNSSNYFNIWVVNIIENDFGAEGTILGYAQFPGWGAWNTYGVVVRADAFNSRTLTHEMGHCIGLYHTFQSSCGNDCSNSGDDVCDTPPSFEETYACSKTQNSCSNDANGPSAYSTNVVDQIENYMSYDDCQNMFTKGQKERAYATFAQNTPLQTLTSSSNLIATGTSDTATTSLCAPFAEFSFGKSIVCAGTPIQFTDMSYNGAVETYNWTFGDGNQSDVKNPLHTFNQPGTYTVSLTVTNDVGTDTETKTSIVEVRPITGGLVAPVKEDFENKNFPSRDDMDMVKEWSIEPSNGWKINSFAQASGDYSLSVSLKSLATDEEYALISPPLDFNEPDRCTDLKFKYAFAERTAGNSDILKIQVSKLCGVEGSWTTIQTLEKEELTTASSYLSTTYLPESSEWKEAVVSLKNYLFQDNIMVKFSVLNGGGNILYLDDIDFGCTDQKVEGIAESIYGIVEVYPNPFKENLTLEFTSAVTENGTLSISDNLGRKVYENAVRVLNGNNKIIIDKRLHNISEGVYMIKLSTPSEAITKKIISY